MARKRRNDRNHVIYQLTGPNGQRYDGKGVAPDVEMRPILSDLLGSTDSVLDAAVKRLTR